MARVLGPGQQGSKQEGDRGVGNTMAPVAFVFVRICHSFFLSGFVVKTFEDSGFTGMLG